MQWASQQDPHSEEGSSYLPAASGREVGDLESPALRTGTSLSSSSTEITVSSSEVSTSVSAARATSVRVSIVESSRGSLSAGFGKLDQESVTHELFVVVFMFGIFSLGDAVELDETVSIQYLDVDRSGTERAEVVLQVKPICILCDTANIETTVGCSK